MTEREAQALARRAAQEQRSVLRTYLRRGSTRMPPSGAELVADRAVLDASADAFSHASMDAVLVRHDGAAVSRSATELA